MECVIGHKIESRIIKQVMQGGRSGSQNQAAKYVAPCCLLFHLHVLTHPDISTEANSTIQITKRREPRVNMWGLWSNLRYVTFRIILRMYRANDSQEFIPTNTHFHRLFLDLLQRIFVYDPKNRITAKQALQHPWFKETLIDDGTEALRIGQQLQRRRG